MLFFAFNLPPARRFHQTVTIILLAVSLVFSAHAAPVTFPTAQLAIGKRHFTVEEARTPEQLEQGLMFRKKIGSDKGMLFIFKQPQIVQMWMKDTTIPLDMLFIDAAGKIIHIAPNTTPESLSVITTEAPVKAVLELAAGTCEKQGIKIGEAITHADFNSSAHP